MSERRPPVSDFLSRRVRRDDEDEVAGYSNKQRQLTLAFFLADRSVGQTVDNIGTRGELPAPVGRILAAEY